ncbi:hypothetical protein GV64_10990 [Endozoicomonas elysicola]|uniref:Uncharacterized protein n=2 Tax=Endozoicomonas elysicola TaxID=305900 RepID=A0A081KAM0_9GAMM|nr:hypothetical protein GV64_10990 [Endozoicomonas elysicola]
MCNHRAISSVHTVKHLPINDDHNLNNDFKKKVRKIQHRYLSVNDQRMIKTHLISLYQPSPVEIPPCSPRKREYTCWQTFYNRAATRVIPKELNEQYSTVLINVLSDQQCFDYFQIQRNRKSKTVDLGQVYHWLKTEDTFIHCYPKWISEQRPYRVYICTKTRFSGVLLDKMLTHNRRENKEKSSPDFKLKIIAQQQAHLREETFVSYHPSFNSALSWARNASRDELAYCLQGQAPSNSSRPFQTNSIGIFESSAGNTALKIEATSALESAVLSNPYI